MFQALRLEACMAQRRSFGGPAPEETARQIKNMETFIAARRHG